MYFILNPRIGLRSWKYVPYAYYTYRERNARGLKKEEFEILIKCDGCHGLERTELLEQLIKRDLCRPCKKGTELTEWQKHKSYENRIFPAMNWMITGKCNYNCLHCFNASDNSRLQSQFTLEEAERLIAQAQECGINAITLTGGEPTVHPHFTDIIKSVYRHGMYVNELNTNGSLLTKDLLDSMKEIGCKPLMKISFDGIGFHDWMRNKEGAEKDAVRAMKLCVENGFEVKAQVNVHRLNVESMLPTAKMLDSIGVGEMRIIRTTEAPRWKQNAGDSSLTLEEYFDAMLKFLGEYIKSGCGAVVDIWQFATVFPSLKTFTPSAVLCQEGKYRPTIPVCRANRGMVAVGANGNLYPCHQMSGYYEKQGDFLGNVKEKGLKACLIEGKYIDEVCTTVQDLYLLNEKCRNCKWFRYCTGGCRAVGLALTGDKMGSDYSKCLFFEKGYMDKLEKTMTGYTNTRPIK